MKRIIPPLFVLWFALIVIVVALDNARAVMQKDNVGKSQRSPEEIYAKECATCHGKDGRAKTFKSKFIHARNFTDTQWQDSVSDERLFNSITNGKGKMPAWRKKLSEAEINSLVKYVRSFKK
jgi:cytochrome c6